MGKVCKSIFVVVITSLYMDPRKGLLLLASLHFEKDYLGLSKENFVKKKNLRHALLLLLCEGADDMWRLGQYVLRIFWGLGYLVEEHITLGLICTSTWGTSRTTSAIVSK